MPAGLLPRVFLAGTVCSIKLECGLTSHQIRLLSWVAGSSMKRLSKWSSSSYDMAPMRFLARKRFLDWQPIYRLLLFCEGSRSNLDSSPLSSFRMLYKATIRLSDSACDWRGLQEWR